MTRIRVLGLLAVVLAFPVFADAPGVYAITGGTVHPVNGPEIANGVVIIRDGLIEAVGANVPIPADASTIDVKGNHIYPGLIDAQTSLGFPSAAPPRRGRGGAAARTGQTPPPQLPETSPAYIAAREIKLSDDRRSRFAQHSPSSPVSPSRRSESSARCGRDCRWARYTDRHRCSRCFSSDRSRSPWTR